MSEKVFHKFLSVDGVPSWEQLDFPPQATQSTNAVLVPFSVNTLEKTYRLAPLSPSDLQACDFLDERLLFSALPDFFLERPLLNDTRASRTPALSHHLLFHFGHCGSTSLSRLFAQATDIVSFREPGIGWSLYRAFEDDQTLLQPILASFLKELTTYQEVLGSTLIKPSSLHTEAYARHVMPHLGHGKVVVLSHRWETCILNQLRKSSNELNRDYTSYYRHALEYFNRNEMNPEFRHRIESVSTDADQILIGWCAKASLLGELLTEKDFTRRLVWVEFEDYILHPQKTVKRLGTMLEVSSLTDSNTSLSSLGKGESSFRVVHFLESIDRAKRHYAETLEACGALLAALRRSCPHFDANLQRVEEYMHMELSATAGSSRN